MFIKFYISIITYAIKKKKSRYRLLFLMASITNDNRLVIVQFGDGLVQAAIDH